MAVFRSQLMGTRLTSNVLAVTVGLATVYIVSSVTRMLQRQRQLPPGPWNWPIVGFLFSLGSRHDLVFRKLSERFGKVFRLKIGERQVVVISDPEVVREAFLRQGNITSDRFKAIWTGHAYGEANYWRLITNNGHVWKYVRRIVGPALRDVGPTGGKMESIILEEADHLVEVLDAQADREEGFDPSDSIVKAISNVIFSLTYGSRFDYDDEMFCETIECINVVFGSPARSLFLLSFFPFLYYTETYRTFRERAATLQKHMESIVKHAEQQGKDNTDVSSLTEAILREIQSNPPDSGQVRMEAKYVWRILLDLIIAGSDTTATTIRWAVIIMAHNPDVQRKVQEEIDSKVGAKRKLTQQDRNKMPYTQATFLEILRIRPVGPLGLPHVTTQDTRLGGYLIPKGTLLYIDISSMHTSRDYWHEPEEFRPERFLDESTGQLAQINPAYMPFGMGPRICPGEYIAKLELYFVFTRLMQRFSFEFPVGEEPVELDDGVYSDAVLHPRPCKLVIRSR